MPGTKTKFEKETEVTVDGVSVRVRPKKLEDVRTVVLMGKLMDENVELTKKLTYLVSFMEIVFADDALEVMDTVAAHNDDFLDMDTYMDWFGKVLEAVDAKNS